jgi:hypothetical protein
LYQQKGIEQMTKQIKVSAEAFARKVELGAGFRGVAIVTRPDGSKERIETAVNDSQQKAWIEICEKIWAIGRPASVAHFASNQYRKNYIIFAE